MKIYRNIINDQQSTCDTTFFHVISNLFFLSILSSVTVYLTELLYFGDVLKTSQWFWSYKWNTLYNMLLVLLVEIIIYVITENEIAGFFVTAILAYLLAVISDIKYQARGEVLRLSDIQAFKEGIQVINDYSFEIPMVVWGVLIITVIFSMILYSRKSERVRIPIIARIAVVFCLIFTIRYLYITDKKIGIISEKSSMAEIDRFYDVNGFLVSYLRTYSGDIEKPRGYSEKSVASIIESIQEEPIIEEDSIQPDIIVVLMESLYDLSRIPEVEFNQDPLEEFKSLQEQYISGMMMTPVRGGGTCNAEYELLTGYLRGNTPDIDLIYQSGVIKRNPGSIVELLNDAGYLTMALHPNDGDFFSRDYIYPLMGFDETIFKENMSDYVNEGAWISDSSLYARLIEEYENRDPAEKFFAFAITMQLHGGYDYEYNKYGIRCISSSLSGEQKTQLNTYANLEYGSVEELRKLLEYFSTVHHPVVVVAFGDHAPGTEAFGFSGETNPICGNEEFYTYQTTPLLIWNNYIESNDDWGTISSYKLGGAILKYCNIPLDSYFKYLLSEDIPEGSGMFFFDGDKLVHKGDLDRETMNKLNDLWILQYDRMFGENYEKTER